MKCIISVSFLAGVLLPAAVEAARAEPFDWPPPAGVGPREAVSVFLQAPRRLNGVASDTEHYFAGVPSWSEPADDITLTSAATIVRIRWWSFFGDNFDPNPHPPAGDETIRIRFLAARPGDGLPGDELYAQDYLNLTRTDTGFIVAVGAGPHEFRYEADLAMPFEMAANTKYWLEIMQVGDIDSYYRWEAAASFGGSYAFRSNFFPDWQYVSPRATAFELIGIPEPSVGLLGSLIGVVFLVTRVFSRRER